MVYHDDDHNCQTTFPLNIIMIILLFILGIIIQIIKNFSLMLYYYTIKGPTWLLLFISILYK